MGIGDVATVTVDGEHITGEVYHVRENGWPCVMTGTGRQASGPAVVTLDQRRELCATEDVTLNGKPAVICGARSPFATVAHLGDPATGLAGRVRMGHGRADRCERGCVQVMTAPSHVVVDTRDGYVFRSDSTGVPFGYKPARAFADQRNAGLKPEHGDSYQVFSLVHCPELPEPGRFVDGRLAGKHD